MGIFDHQLWFCCLCIFLKNDFFFLQNNNITDVNISTFCRSNDTYYLRPSLSEVRLDGNPVMLSKYPDSFTCMHVLPIGQYRWGGRKLTAAPQLLKEQFPTTEWWALYRDILKVGELVPWSQFYKVFTSANLQLVTLSDRNEMMVPSLYWPEGSSCHLNVRRKFNMNVRHTNWTKTTREGVYFSNHLVCLWPSLKISLIGRKAITSLGRPFGQPVQETPLVF